MAQQKGEVPAPDYSAVNPEVLVSAMAMQSVREAHGPSRRDAVKDARLLLGKEKKPQTGNTPSHSR